ncbi:MAG: sigma-70 family RNA polymerase sigma factor [Cyanobacteria bacterium P01_H01_bin.74]
MPLISQKNSNDDIFNETLESLVTAYLASDSHDQGQRTDLRASIVNQVMPYVRKIALSLARRSSDPVEDLVQVGNIGLLKALEKYNPLMGSSFKTYSTYFITGEIRHYLRDKTSMIKAPRQMYELYYRVNQLVQELTEKLGHVPSDLEIAEALQCPVSKVTQAQEIERRRLPVSLDQFATEGNGYGQESGYIERLVDQQQVSQLENNENRILVEKALNDLKPELSSVVRMTFYEDLSQTEIADRLGISQMQVSRRLRKALGVLSQSRHLLQ